MADVAMPDTSAPAPVSGDIEMPEVPTAVPEVHESETLYIQNLNEKIKIAVMKQTLKNLFKLYGPVLDVVAHANLRMRGQAFVSFDDKETAAKAMREVKGLPLYQKPMQITFARTRSDAVIAQLDSAELDKHKAVRLEHKRRQRFQNPHAVKLRAKRKAEKVEGAAPVPATKRPNVLMPDEYLPPNKILFLQNLPESVTKEQLNQLFSQYPNLHEVRLVPVKKDIAFVEYVDEASATAAKEALHNHRIDGETKIKVTFARK
ncbi:RNA binding protein [Auriculariales sp. MPI-PUGE-AT-0066]|nr:RNA binding protein [Auriculariales sp. MPI-PUGE-AT-0066]